MVQHNVDSIFAQRTLLFTILSDKFDQYSIFNKSEILNWLYKSGNSISSLFKNSSLLINLFLDKNRYRFK